jgi:hypothetical protein
MVEQCSVNNSRLTQCIGERKFQELSGKFGIIGDPIGGQGFNMFSSFVLLYKVFY